MFQKLKKKYTELTLYPIFKILLPKFVTKNFENRRSLKKKYIEMTFYPIFKFLVPKSLKIEEVFKKNIIKKLRGIIRSRNDQNTKIQLLSHKILDFFVFLAPIPLILKNFFLTLSYFL